MARKSNHAHKPDPEDDALDSLLAEARWPGLEQLRVERLARQWDRISPRQSRRRVWRLLAAAAVLAAATIGLIVGGWSRLPHRGRIPVAQPPHPLREPAGPAPADRESMKSHTAIVAPPADATPPESPSALERVLIAIEQRRAQQRQPSTLPTPSPAADELVSRMVADPSLDPGELVAGSTAADPRLELELASLVRKSNGDSQLAAARLLTHVATRRSWELLLELKQWPALGKDAAGALARLGDPRVLAQLIAAEQSPELQRVLLAGLLEQGSSQAVEQFLRLAADGATSAAALKSLRDVRNPPLDELFGYLQHSRVLYRTAAARALGRLNDSQINQRLIQMVRRDFARHEALLALAESSEPEAREFLANAQADLALTALVHAAHVRRQALPN